MEKHPEIFSGGLAACGPIGDYQQQVDYIGDFRVVFDYLFGPENPRWPIWTPTRGPGEPKDWDDWASQLAADAIAANQDKTQQLLTVTAAPIDRADPNSLQKAVLHVLSYSFLYTNDLIAKVGGLPYDNLGRLPNLVVARFDSHAALDNYTTTGQLSRPLVTLHTTGDEIVPYWHEDLYWQKVLQNPDSYRLHANLKVQRDGHCNFTTTEMLSAFSLLVLMVDGQNMVIAKDALPSAAARAEFLRLARQYGAAPEIVDRSVIGARAMR